MPSERKRLGELLVERGVIDRHQLKVALERQRKWGKRLGETLLELSMLSENQFTKILSELYRVPALDLEKFTVDRKALAFVKGEFCREHNLVPIALKKIQGKTRLVIAMADPSDVNAVDQVKFMSNLPIAATVAPLAAVQRTIERHYFTSSGGREEITLTSLLNNKEEQMEVIREGRQEKVLFGDEGKVDEGRALFDMPLTHEARLKLLVQFLLVRRLLTEEEAQQVLRGID